jgi:penicillin-binding protein 1A
MQGKARTLRRLLLASLLTIGLLAAAGFGILAHFSSQLPPLSALEHPPQVSTTKVLSSDGETLYEFYTENRIPIALEDMSPWILKAFLAMEDTEFYEHWGVNLRRLAGAFLIDLRERRIAQGASTITQQLARLLYLDRKKTIARKIKEALLSLRIERMYTKDEILTMYLNQIYFGEGAYGVEAAAQEYFGKHASELGPEEAAILPPAHNNPSRYGPRRRPENSLNRRNVGLTRMAEVGMITYAECESLKAIPLSLAPDRTRPSKAPYFVDYVRRQIVTLLGTDALLTEGLEVHTTLDYDLQRRAEQIVEEFLTEKEKSQGYRFKRSEGDTAGYVQSAVVLMDATKGYVRVFIGGRDFYESQFNLAVDATRQPGSAFKPFVYTTAIDKGYYPSQLILDAPIVVPMVDSTIWRPKNFDERFKGSIPLRQALRESRNVCAVKLSQEIGPETVVRYVKRFGITTPIDPFLAMAIGSEEVKLMEMVRAYSVFANMGLMVEPICVTKVTRNGETVFRARREATEVIDPRTAYIMTNMLESVVKAGTGHLAVLRGFRRPAGGKTGTTNDCNNAWFIGFTPDYVCGVWTGFSEQLKTLGKRQTGALAALPMWTDIMLEAHKGLPPKSFPTPPGIIRVAVCTDTGMLPSSRCPHVSEEVFREGDEPKLLCPVHQAPEMDREEIPG